MPKTRQFSSAVAVLFVVTAMVASSPGAAGQTASSDKERELIAVLRSDAPAAEKAITCKNLAIYGSSEAVPDLARLLADEQLASWARIALEAIPGPAADEALRKANDSLQGRLLVGAINSIGVRRDALAADLLSARLGDQDAEVASAAAVALGRIGNAAAAKSLRGALATAPSKVRSAVAEGCVLCAERFLSEGNAAEATAIYDEVRHADVPRQRILEATRGAILSRNDEGIPLLLEQLRSPDKALFQIALSTAREFPGRRVDEALAAELDRTAPERAALVIGAMADRKETVVLPAVLKAAERGPKPVRLAAIGALGRVGDASCLSPLLNIALESDADLVQTAKGALSDLPGDSVDKDIVSRLSKADGKMYPLLIELVGQRRIEAVSLLLKALDNSDRTVRRAALTSLGSTVPAKSLSVLIAQAVAPKFAEDAPVAQKALKEASVRMPDREACATELAAAFDRAPGATKSVLLEILGAVGGTKALNTLGAAAKSNDPQLQDTSTRLLGEWMTIDAAPVLLDLAKNGRGDKYEIRALRGYIRIARQFVMPEKERVEMCRSAWNASRQSAEKKLLLEVFKRYPSLEMLKLTIEAIAVPDLKDEATQAALAIAQKVNDKERGQAVELLSDAVLKKVKLEIVKAEYGSGETLKDVTETLQKHAGESQLIVLPNSNFNSAFGDPAPGAVKQLKIQYRINGKSGEATFAENALIILAVPK
jgi:HEAT repeat protein